MQRFHQFVFVISLLGMSWQGMMAVHELGHVVGAAISGATVRRVVLHPATISRTEVSPNPHPGIVVWMGPLVGCALPLATLALVPSKFRLLKHVAQFFAGFCLIANGAYISTGWVRGVGDSGDMLRAGTPVHVMAAFGLMTVPLGLYLWHRLGSIKDFFARPTLITARTALATALIWGVVLAVESALSSR